MKKIERPLTTAVQVLFLVSLSVLTIFLAIRYMPVTYRSEGSNAGIEQKVIHCTEGDLLRLGDLLGDADRYYYESHAGVKCYTSPGDEIMADSGFSVVRGVYYGVNEMTTQNITIYAVPLPNEPEEENPEPVPPEPTDSVAPTVHISSYREVTYVGIGLVLNFDVTDDVDNHPSLELNTSEGEVDQMSDGTVYFIATQPCVANITLKATDIAGNTATKNLEVTVLERDSATIFEHYLVYGTAIFDSSLCYILDNGTLHGTFLEGDYLFESQQEMKFCDLIGEPFVAVGQVNVRVTQDSVTVTHATGMRIFDKKTTYFEFKGSGKLIWSYVPKINN